MYVTVDLVSMEKLLVGTLCLGHSLLDRKTNPELKSENFFKIEFFFFHFFILPTLQAKMEPLQSK